MGKNIGNLSVLVSASTASLEKGMLRASNHVRGFGKSVNGVGAFIKNNLLGVGLAALAGGYGVQQFGEIAKGIDETAKSADRLGLTTQAYIGLRHAADLAGASSEDFDSAMTGMTKNVGLAERGLGRARTAFAYLDINAKKLAQLSPENQFKVLAEYISKVENPTQRLTLATQIFGDAGAKMIAVLADGAAGLEKVQQRCEATGQSFSRFDAAKVEIMNDAITDLKAELGVIGQKLVVELAPIVTGLVNAFRAWSASGKSWGEIVSQAVNITVTSVGYLFDLLDYGKIAWEGLKIVGAGAMLAMLTPIGLMITGLNKLILMAGDYLPDAIVNAAKANQAFVDGFADGLTQVAKDSAQKIKDIALAPAMSDKIANWIRQQKIATDQAAQKIADAAPKPFAFSKDMVDRVRGAEKVLAIEEKIADLHFEPNKAIRAGSAEAQALPFVTAQKLRDQQLQKQIDLHKQELAALKRIDKNTAVAGDEGVPY